MSPRPPTHLRAFAAAAAGIFALLASGCATTSTSDPWAAADQSGRFLGPSVPSAPGPQPGRTPAGIHPAPIPAPAPAPVAGAVVSTSSAPTSATSTAPAWTTNVGTAAPTASAGSSGYAAREIRTVRADLWFTGKPAATGFGQYTYVVLLKPSGEGAAVTAAANTRLLTLALGRDSAAAAEDSAFTRQREINHVLVPVLAEDAPTRLVGPLRTAEQVQPVYHYNFAEKLISNLGLAGRPGPFLFSSNVPLPPSLELRGQYIVQDLSRCSPQIAEMWWGLFISASNRSNFWEWNDVSGTKLLARFYGGLEFLGTWAPQAQSVIKEQIAFITGK